MHALTLCSNATRTNLRIAYSYHNCSSHTVKIWQPKILTNLRSTKWTKWTVTAWIVGERQARTLIVAFHLSLPSPPLLCFRENKGRTYQLGQFSYRILQPKSWSKIQFVELMCTIIPPKGTCFSAFPTCSISFIKMYTYRSLRVLKATTKYDFFAYAREACRNTLQCTPNHSCRNARKIS